MPKDFYGIRADSISDAFSIAAANSLLSEMKQMLDDGHDVNAIARYCGGTALHTAAGLALIRSVEFLIGNGADLNATDKNDLTPLMNACSTGKVKGSQFALRLIAAGADVIYVRAADEMTALKFAAKSCIDEVLQALIDRGANVDGPPGADQTALMLAARSNNVSALKVLVANGADISLPCKLKWAAGWTAEGLAEMEKRGAALAYLRGLKAP